MFYQAQGRVLQRHKQHCNMCVTKMLSNLDQLDIEHIIFYNDTCGSHNRNSILGAAIINFLCIAIKMFVIEQKFFESGHSQIKCDSMHLAIDHALQGLDINLPTDYQQCMQIARKSQLSVVGELSHEYVMDFRTLSKQVASPATFNRIMKAHHVKYQGQGGDLVVTMAQDIDKDVTVVKYRRRGGRINLGQQMPNAYIAPPGIDGEKKKDLLSLVNHLRSQSMGLLFYGSLSIQGTTKSEQPRFVNDSKTGPLSKHGFEREIKVMNTRMKLVKG